MTYAQAFGVSVCLVASTWSPWAHAATTELGPADVAVLEATINAMSPGDEVVLQGGDYILPAGVFRIMVSGTAVAPVTIRAKRGEQPVLHPPANQNGIEIDGAAHLVIRGLELTGVADGHGIRLSDSGSITIIECRIHDVFVSGIIAADSGDTYDDLSFLRNEIFDTGAEGVRLGCISNDCRVTNSLIENNLIYNTGTEGAGEGIDLKEGSHSNSIRDNVIHTTVNGWPCLLIASTLGVGDRNHLEGNVMWGCGGDGIQVTAYADLWNNIVLGTGNDGINLQTLGAGTPGDLDLRHNTVLSPNGNAIRGSDFTGSLTLANNALYSEIGDAIRFIGTAPNPGVITGNAGEGDLTGVAGGFDDSGDIRNDFVAAGYTGTVPNDVFPAIGGILPGSGDSASVIDRDFNGLQRAGAADVGAYRFSAGGNTWWAIQAGLKTVAIFADAFESGDISEW